VSLNKKEKKTQERKENSEGRKEAGAEKGNCAVKGKGRQA